MGLFEELLEGSARAASKTAKKQRSPERDAPLTFSRRALQQRADEINDTSDFMSNLSSFFRAPGTFARTAIDTIGGEGRTAKIARGWKAESDKRRKDDAELRDVLRWNQGMEGGGAQDNMLRDLPNMQLFEAASPILDRAKKAYRQNILGMNDPEEYLTPKFKQRLAAAKQVEEQQAQRLAALQRGDDRNIIERAADAVLPGGLAELFQRRNPDLSDVAANEGWTTTGAIAGSMLNPLEWLGAESKASLAGKMANAGKARKALNAAGRYLDPVQVGIDALTDAAPKVRNAFKGAAKSDAAKPSIPERMRESLDMEPAAVKAVDEAAQGSEEAKPLLETLLNDEKPSIDWSVRPKPYEAVNEAVDSAIPAPPPALLPDELKAALDDMGQFEPIGPPRADAIPGSAFPEGVPPAPPVAPALRGEESAKIIEDALKAKKVKMPKPPEGAPKALEADAIAAGQDMQSLIDSWRAREAEWLDSIGRNDIPGLVDNGFRSAPVDPELIASISKFNRDERLAEAIRELENIIANLGKKEDVEGFEQWYRALADDATGGNIVEEASQGVGGVAARQPGGAAESLEVQGGRPSDMGAEALPEPAQPAMDLVDGNAASGVSAERLAIEQERDRLHNLYQELMGRKPSTRSRALGTNPDPRHVVEYEARKKAWDKEWRKYLRDAKKNTEASNALLAKEQSAAAEAAKQQAPAPTSKPITQRIIMQPEVAKEVLETPALKAALREESGISGEIMAQVAADTPAVDPTKAKMQQRLDALRSKPRRTPSEHREMLEIQDILGSDVAPQVRKSGRAPRTGNARNTDDGLITLSMSIGGVTGESLRIFNRNARAAVEWAGRKVQEFRAWLGNGNGLAFSDDWVYSARGSMRDAYRQFRRFFKNQGIVDSGVAERMAAFDEASTVMTRTVGDVFSAVQRGDLRTILGREAPRYALTPEIRADLRQFMVGKADRASLAGKVPDDVLDAGAVVREWMDDASIKLMAEQHRIQYAFLKALNDEQFEVVRSLSESATKPNVRAKVEKDVADAIANGSVAYDAQFFDKAKQFVDQGVKELESQGLWLAEESRPRDMLLNWGAFNANRGSYDPRLYHFYINGVPSKNIGEYIKHLENVSGKKFPEDLVNEIIVRFNSPAAPSGNALRDMDRVRKRKDLSEEFKRLYMEVNDPAYTFAVGIAQVNSLKEKLKIRRWAATQERFVSKAGEDVNAFLARTGFPADEVVTLQSDPRFPGAMGALEGRHVHFDFADLMQSMHVVNNGLPNDAVQGIAQRFMRAWKEAHTVLEFTGQIRQMAQNTWTVFEHGGIKGLKNMNTARDEFMNSGPLYLEARRAGIFSGRRIEDFAEAINDSAWKELPYNTWETMASNAAYNMRGGAMDFMASVLEGGVRAAHFLRKNLPKKAGEWWQSVDDIARMALYKTIRESGGTQEEAVKAIKDAIYSGQHRTYFESMMSHSPVSRLRYKPNTADRAVELGQLALGMPFWGSQRWTAVQSLKGLAGMKAGTWTPMSHPARFARNMGMVSAFVAMHQASKWIDGLSTEEEIKQRPDYMRDVLPTGFFRVPEQVTQLIDGEGRVAYLDTRWLFPWGRLASGAFDARNARMMQGSPRNPEALKGLEIGGFEVPFSPMIQPFVEIAANKDSFFGRPVNSKWSPDTMEARIREGRKTLSHVWRAWTPSWLPNPLGIAGGLYESGRMIGDGSSEVEMKELLRTMVQALADDSGHSFSKMASGIYNSFDWWFDAHGKSLMKDVEVQDYKGRPWFLATALLNMFGARLDIKDKRASERSRQLAKKSVISDMSRYYNDRIEKTRNPHEKQRLRNEFREAAQRIKNGEPEPRWYDDTTHLRDVVNNAFHFIQNAPSLRVPRKGPTA